MARQFFFGPTPKKVCPSLRQIKNFVHESICYIKFPVFNLSRNSRMCRSRRQELWHDVYPGQDTGMLNSMLTRRKHCRMHSDLDFHPATAKGMHVLSSTLTLNRSILNPQATGLNFTCHLIILTLRLLISYIQGVPGGM